VVALRRHSAPAQQLNAAWDEQSVPPYAGSSWTTDAPFRETEQAIAAVEMEAAALYALAAAKGYPIVGDATITALRRHRS
jgi:hypothetical protein